MIVYYNDSIPSFCSEEEKVKILKNHLSFRQEIVEKVKKFCTDNNIEKSKTLGFHLRRTDLVSRPTIYEVKQKIRETLSSLEKNINFFVFADCPSVQEDPKGRKGNRLLPKETFC